MAPLVWGSLESLGLLERLMTYFRFRGFVVIKWVVEKGGRVGRGGEGWGRVGWGLI